MNTRCLRYTVSGQAKALSIPPGEYAGSGESLWLNHRIAVETGGLEYV